MLNDYVDYYYYFLHARHYFECHEIMEDAWKNKVKYHKNDLEVGLILLATSQYHLRRGNIKGAQTCLRKAHAILENKKGHLMSAGLETTVLSLLAEQLTSTQYEPLSLPLTDDMRIALKKRHPDFEVRSESDARWIHYHKTRDRQAVIAARAQSMRDKHPVDDAPGKRHND
ncbi:DUF309 domain-containing protein [Macrococcus carouselicus]|nr:DUF309 domain-containing protein [Macrococcus carouselicus]